MLDREFQESLCENNAILARREEVQKWGAFLDATRADRPRVESRPEKKATSMVNEKLGWDGRQIIGANISRAVEAIKDRDERFIVSTSGGNINLKRVVDRWDEGQGFWMDKDDSRLDFNTITNQDPFAEPNQAVPWLLTDDYSPLCLDGSLPYKLHQSFYKTDADDSYFRGDYQPGDLYPRFACESITRHDPRLAEKVNWRAAFHDLLEVHHKATLVPSSQLTNAVNLSTTINPGRWISYLIDQGSLGPKWRTLPNSDLSFGPYRFRYGHSTEAWAVSSFLGQRFIREHNSVSPVPQYGNYETKNDSLDCIAISAERTNNEIVLAAHPERLGRNMSTQTSRDGKQSNTLDEVLDTAWLSHRPAFAEAAISLIRNPDTAQATLRTVDRVLRLIENPELEDEVERILNKTFGGVDLTAPRVFEGWLDVVDHLYRNEHFETWKATKEAVEAQHHDVYGISVKDIEKESSSSSSTSSSDSKLSSFSSSSSSSYSSTCDSSLNDSPDSIISTLTTVQSRTLPDGRVETKRILKKRFANGREENSESTETLSAPKDPSPRVGAPPKSLSAKISDIHKPSVQSAQKDKEAGGWFWK